MIPCSGSTVSCHVGKDGQPTSLLVDHLDLPCFHGRPEEEVGLPSLTRLVTRQAVGSSPTWRRACAPKTSAGVKLQAWRLSFIRQQYDCT